MLMLIAGLVLFLGTHALRLLFPSWRNRALSRMGTLAWRAVISAVSLLSLVLLCLGWSRARMTTHLLWAPPWWMHWVTSAVVLVALILLVGFFIEGSAPKALVPYPVTGSVALWAFAHLLSNGSAVDVLLFGAILAWSLWNLAQLQWQRHVQHRRELESRSVPDEGVKALPPGGASWTPVRTLAALVAGIALWALIAFVLHVRVIGLAPFGLTL